MRPRDGAASEGARACAQARGVASIRGRAGNGSESEIRSHGTRPISASAAGRPRQPLRRVNTVILQQPKRVLFGDGTTRLLPEEFSRHNWKRIFVVTGP